MRILGMETATLRHSVAVVEGELTLAEVSYRAEGTRSRPLLSTVKQVLEKAGIVPQDVDAIAVSIGPGSFTGVRVGLATAKGLALGTGARVLGVSTLETLAGGYPVSDATICALLDAGRGEVYAALFVRQGEGRQRVSPDAVLTPEAAATLLGTQQEVHLIGNGAARYREQLAAALGGRGRFTEEGLAAVPSAGVLARLGQGLLTGGRMASAEVVPVYLRRADAEVNWEKGLLKSPLERVLS